MPNREPTAATRQHMINAAHRVAADPAGLARAVRVVRAALDQGLIEADELTPLPRNGELVNA